MSGERWAYIPKLRNGEANSCYAHKGEKECNATDPWNRPSVKVPALVRRIKPSVTNSLVTHNSCQDYREDYTSQKKET